MRDISDQLLCVFSGQLEVKDNSIVVEVPHQELELGSLRAGETYRIAVLSSPDGGHGDERLSRPPVREGERRTVAIEDLGEQGDGIARIEHGYVVIIPNTEVGEEVTVEITDVQPNVAFGEVTDA